MRRIVRLLPVLALILAVFVLSGHAALTTVNYSSSMGQVPATLCFQGGTLPGGNQCSQIVSGGTATVPAGATTASLTVPATVNTSFCTPTSSCYVYFQSWQDGTTGLTDTVNVATAASTVSFVATFSTTPPPPPGTCSDFLGCTSGIGNTTWLLSVIIIIAVVALVYTRR